MVYASPNIPAPRAVSDSRSVADDFSALGGLPPSSALARAIRTPSAIPAAAPDRPPPPPPLTRAEHEQKVLEGKAIAEKARLEYKRHITELSERYGISPAEVHRGLDAVRRSQAQGAPVGARGKMGWEEIKARMDGLFARAA